MSPVPQNGFVARCPRRPGGGRRYTHEVVVQAPQSIETISYTCAACNGARRLSLFRRWTLRWPPAVAYADRRQYDDKPPETDLRIGEPGASWYYRSGQ